MSHISPLSVFHLQTALQLADRKHGSLHFQATALALNEESEETCQNITTKNDMETCGKDNTDNAEVKPSAINTDCSLEQLTCELDKHSSHSENINEANSDKNTGRKAGNNVLEQNPAEDISEILQKYGNRQPTPIIPSATSESNCITHTTTAATTCSNKMRYFREAFITAKTSGIVNHQLERRRSEIQEAPFSTQPRKVPRKSVNMKDVEKNVNCAHKVNLTFRQSEPGSKESFAEHFNFRRRKVGLGTRNQRVNSKGRNNIRVNLTPIYTRIKTPRKHKRRAPLDRDKRIETTIKIYHQANPSAPRPTQLTRLIEDVQLANTPVLADDATVLAQAQQHAVETFRSTRGQTTPVVDDVTALTQAQRDAMATFKSTRGQKKQLVPSDFHKRECNRRVKVAKRKSIEVPNHKTHRKRISPSHCAKDTSKSIQSSSRLVRRKLSMEETLERYRNRNPARSPCMCQPQNEKEKSENTPSEGNFKTDTVVKKKASTLPEIAPPLVSVSTRLKPLAAQPTQDLSHTV